MRIADLTADELAHSLRRHGIWLDISRFSYRIRSPVPAIAKGIARLYADYPCSTTGPFADFHVRLAPPGGFRHWIARQVAFEFDGVAPFHPFPYHQAMPMLEWGMNWCVSSQCRHLLVVHAGVAELGGRAAIFPAPPGAGKSTLCAALALRGWRLLSDELALIDFRTGLLEPLARPVNLKNRSIEVIRAFDRRAVLSDPVADTSKGTIAHMRLPQSQAPNARETARPAWIIFPRYQPGAIGEPEPFPKARSFIRLAEQSFNYGLSGRSGYETVAGLIERCTCWEFQYGDLDQAVHRLTQLAIEAPA